MSRKGKERPPDPMVMKTSRGLRPVSAYDEEALEGFRIGQMFDLVPRNERSRKHLRLYFGTLNKVIQTTGSHPRAEELHDDLKLSLGYTRPGYDFKERRKLLLPGSIAFDKMTQSEFNRYFDSAMALIEGHYGFDPLTLTRRRR